VTGNERDISGGAGNDTLYGASDADTLRGDGGNDTLYGDGGNDILIGGEGNDKLQGEKGNDTYYFARGDGQDTIYDYDTTTGNVDAIEFAGDIAPDDVQFLRSGSHLILELAESTDQIIVSNFFSNAAYEIEEVRFADGTTWNQTDLLDILGI
ncbi:MAG: hypothetical protein LBF61_04220, partial [Azoarcus sp.]|nr:hypothetical protein [Azoarcus sp.]